MVRVVVTGTEGRTAQRLVPHLRDLDGVEAVATARSAATAGEFERFFDGADAVVHLGSATDIGAVLEAATSASVRSLVYRSSATVYGAWPDNPVPLTEDVPIRPNPGFGFALEHAEAERRVNEWRENDAGVTAAILRPASVVAPGDESWESDVLGRPPRLRRSEALPPVQFLHVDDAVTAFAHAVLLGLDGTYNVAADGFVSGETARALATSGLTWPLPDRFAAAAEGWLWRLGWGGAPPAAVPYLTHPWVVANDKLTASGWSASHANEEALVAARRGSWWRELSPQRRQELALGVGTAAGVVSAGAGLLGLRGLARRRRARA